MILVTISVLQCTGHGCGPLAFVSMSDSYNRNFGGHVRLDFCHDFSINTRVMLLYIRIAILMALGSHGYYICVMFSIILQYVGLTLARLDYHRVLIYLSELFICAMYSSSEKYRFVMNFIYIVFDLIGLWLGCNYIILMCEIGFLYCYNF